MQILRRPTSMAVILCSLLILCFGSDADAAGRTQQIRIAYVAPTNYQHVVLHDTLRRARALERMKEFMSPLRLPRPLLLRVQDCDGVANAWYEDETITVCYEYLADVMRNAPTETTPLGVTRGDFLAGMFFDVFLHELGHAVFDQLQIPVLGREEDAADQFSAYVILQLPKDVATRLIGGIALGYALELKLRSAEDLATRDSGLKLKTFADEHGVAAQRLFNVLCIAYGAHPEAFATVVERDILPKSRAEGCEWEYRQVADAWRRLIAPHIDRGLARKVIAKRWIPEVTRRPTRPQASSAAAR